MSDNQIIAFRHPSESDRHWMLRKEFLEKYSSEFPQQTLLSLAQAFADAESQGHRHHDFAHTLPDHAQIDEKNAKISKDAPKEIVQEHATKKEQQPAGIISQNRQTNAAVKDDSQEKGNTSQEAPAKKSSPSMLTSTKSKNACSDVSRDKKKSIKTSEVLHKKTDYGDGSKENKRRHYGTSKKMPISEVLHDKTHYRGGSKENKRRHYDTSKKMPISGFLHDKMHYHDGSKENKRRNYDACKKMPISGVLHDKTHYHGESRGNNKSVICKKLLVSKVSHEKTDCHKKSRGHKESVTCKKLPISKNSHEKANCHEKSRGSKESVTCKKLPISKNSHEKANCHEKSRGNKESVTSKKLPVSRKKTDCCKESKRNKESITFKELLITKVPHVKSDCHEESRRNKESVIQMKLPVIKVEKFDCYEESRESKKSVTHMKLPVIEVKKTDFCEEFRGSKENVICKKLPVSKVSHEQSDCHVESKGNKKSVTCKKLLISKVEKTDCCQESRGDKKINITCKKLPVSKVSQKNDCCEESAGSKKRKFPIEKTGCCDEKKSKKLPVPKVSHEKVSSGKLKGNKKLPFLEVSDENKYCHDDSRENEKRSITCEKLPVSGVPYKNADCHNKRLTSIESGAILSEVSSQSSSQENVNKINSLPKCLKNNFSNILQPVKKALIIKLNAIDALHIVAKRFNFKLEFCTEKLPTGFVSSLKMDTMLISKAEGSTVEKAQTAAAKLAIDKLMGLSQEIGNLSKNYLSKPSVSSKRETSGEKITASNVSGHIGKSLVFENASKSVDKLSTSLAVCGVVKKPFTSEVTSGAVEEPLVSVVAGCAVEKPLIPEIDSDAVDNSFASKVISGAVERLLISKVDSDTVDKSLAYEVPSGAAEKPLKPEVVSGVEKPCTSQVASDKLFMPEVASGAVEKPLTSEVVCGAVEKPLITEVASGTGNFRYKWFTENPHTSQVASGTTENPHTSQVASAAVDQSLTSEVDSFQKNSNVPDRFSSCILNGKKKDFTVHKPYEEIDYQNESLDVLGSTACKIDGVSSQSSSEEAIHEISLFPKHLKDNFLDILQAIKKFLPEKLSALYTLQVVAQNFNLQLKYHIKTLQAHSFECCLNIDSMLFCKADGPTIEKARLGAAKAAIDKLRRLGEKVLFSDDSNLLKFSDPRSNNIKNCVASIKQEVVVSETASIICDDVCTQYINTNSLNCRHSIPSDIRNTVITSLPLYQNSLGTANQTSIAVGCTDSKCNVYGEEAISNCSKRHIPSDFYENTVCKQKALNVGNNSHITSETCENPNFPKPQYISSEENTLYNRYSSSDLYANINLMDLRHNTYKKVAFDWNSSSDTHENKSSQNKTDFCDEREELMSAEQESAIPGVWERSCIDQQRSETVSHGSTKGGMSRSTSTKGGTSRSNSTKAGTRRSTGTKAGTSRSSRSVLNPSNNSSVINGSYSLNMAHEFDLSSKPIINHNKRQTLPKPLRLLITEKRKMHRIWKKSRNPSDKFVCKQLNKIINIALMGYRSNHWDVLEHNTRIAVDIVRLWKPFRMKRNASQRT